MAEKKQQSEADIFISLMQEIIKKGEEFSVDGMVSGQEIVMDLISRISKPETREDKALRALMELEVMERSGQVPPGRRTEFLKMRQLAEVRAGLRAPDEMHDFDNDPGTGWIQKGDKVMFIGDNNPATGKPHEYVAGSEEHKKRLDQMNKKREGFESVQKEPNRIFQAYQKAYDERKSQEVQAQRAQKERGTGRGWYPDMPWSPQDAQKMHEQGFGQPSARKAKEEDLWKAQETAMARGVQPGSGGAADSRPLGQPYDPAQGPPSVGDVARHTSESARQAGRKAGEKAGQMRDQGGVGGWLTSKLTEHIGKQFGWDLSKENRR